jgi:hypothetical protein
MVSYRDYSKLCESCGTGVLHAALQAAEQDLQGEGEEEVCGVPQFNPNPQ